MSSDRILALLVLAAAPLGAAASPLSDKFRRWVDEEVVYLISNEERKQFLQLDSAAARERFIEEFWLGRNREEHYRRLDYVNQSFGHETGTPGWRTDMGRTHILLGPPQSRAKFTTYSQLHPVELWFYANNSGQPSLPPFFYVLFYVPDGIGEYRYYRPFTDGPLKLVRGTQFRTNRDVYRFLKPLGGDLAHAAFSLNPSDPIDTQDFTTSMAGDLIVAKLHNLANDPHHLARVCEARRLQAVVKSFLLIPQDRPLDLTTFVFTDGAGRQWLDYAVWIGDENLAKRSEVRAGYRLLTEDGELIYEDVEERSYAASGGKFQPFLLANRIPLMPGAYKLEVEITDLEGGKLYRAERRIDAPGDKQAWISGPLVAGVAQRADADAPFHYFGAWFLPAVERRVPTGGPLRVLFQLQALGGCDCEVEYLVGHVSNRELRRIWTDAVSPSEWRSGRLLKSKTLPLDGFAPGDYRLVVTLRPRNSPQVLASAGTTIQLDATSDRPPVIHYLSNSRKASSPGVAAYLRALASMAQKK